MSNNFITKIASDIGNHLKGLKALVLTNNRIVNLADVGCLSGLVKLEHLSLLDNPVTLKDKYRLYVIYRIPSLKSLDFQKISKTERAEATEYFASSAGQAMISAIEADAKTDNKDKPKPSLILTEDQKMQVRQAIESASTKEEIDAIEKQLKAGTFVFK